MHELILGSQIKVKPHVAMRAKANLPIGHPLVEPDLQRPAVFKLKLQPTVMRDFAIRRLHNQFNLMPNHCRQPIA
ncbi:hypothetical protein D9M68_984180 [compost metagenome]